MESSSSFRSIRRKEVKVEWGVLDSPPKMMIISKDRKGGVGLRSSQGRDFFVRALHIDVLKKGRKKRPFSSDIIIIIAYWKGES